MITLHHDILLPVKFHPYTSIVTAPIFSVRYKTGDQHHSLHIELVEFFTSTLCAKVCRNPGDGSHCLLPQGHDGHCESVPRPHDQTTRAYMDNKTVFELKDKMINGRIICIGFYDNEMNVGFGVRRLK